MGTSYAWGIGGALVHVPIFAYQMDQVGPRGVLAHRRRQAMVRIEPKGAREFTAPERAAIFVDAGSFVEPPSQVAGGDVVAGPCSTYSTSCFPSITDTRYSS